MVYGGTGRYWLVMSDYLFIASGYINVDDNVDQVFCLFFSLLLDFGLLYLISLHFSLLNIFHWRLSLANVCFVLYLISLHFSLINIIHWRLSLANVCFVYLISNWISKIESTKMPFSLKGKLLSSIQYLKFCTILIIYVVQCHTYYICTHNIHAPGAAIHTAKGFSAYVPPSYHPRSSPQQH